MTPRKQIKAQKFEKATERKRRERKRDHQGKFFKQKSYDLYFPP